ncbi:FAD binding domain protein [Truncatella angustata]|uniref:Delta(24)-sterol reductase n=1 Tax=Truncatella angustata TaxID=152316 RepID=A0A9P8ZYX0_9PEZI|nr:FAD binding domain protein [Truncatella angustata]KAH6654456.1 FAD binding domain protein [Truncatella angustata]
MEAHNNAVNTVARNIRIFHSTQRPFRVYHGSTNSTRTSQRRADNTVDTSRLNHVIQIDHENKTALVEPNVPMDALVQATLEHSLVPLVVMEFPNITVGGGFSGSSGESSSFRYGPFDSIINSIEIVVPSGEIEWASKTAKPDLFWGAASGFGTLGIVTLLEVQLRDAKPYVELTYHMFTSVPEASLSMQHQAQDASIDYLDGIAYASNRAIVCSGRLVNEVSGSTSLSHFTKRKDPWFYQHVDRRTKGASGPVTDYVPLVDYLFRYDRGGFWVAKYAFAYFFTPFNRATRSLLDRFLRAKVMYAALHKSQLSDDYIVQDVGVPYEKVEEFQRWLDANLRTYPLWLCPLRVRRDLPDSRHGLHARFSDLDAPEYLLNFGIWRPGSLNRDKFVRQNRNLEKKVQELGGKKWLYAHAYYTEEEFWASYDRESYDDLRRRYSAAYLPSVYDKVKVDVEAERHRKKPFKGIRPLQGLYGVYKAWKGGDYLLAK